MKVVKNFTFLFNWGRMDFGSETGVLSTNNSLMLLDLSFFPNKELINFQLFLGSFVLEQSVILSLKFLYFDFRVSTFTSFLRSW